MVLPTPSSLPRSAPAVVPIDPAPAPPTTALALLLQARDTVEALMRYVRHTSFVQLGDTRPSPASYEDYLATLRKLFLLVPRVIDGFIFHLAFDPERFPRTQAIIRAAQLETVLQLGNSVFLDLGTGPPLSTLPLLLASFEKQIKTNVSDPMFRLCLPYITALRRPSDHSQFSIFKQPSPSPSTDDELAVNGRAGLANPQGWQ